MVEQRTCEEGGKKEKRTIQMTRSAIHSAMDGLIELDNDEDFPQGNPVLTESLVLSSFVLNQNDTRTLTPFADAVRRLPPPQSNWKRLESVAVLIDRCFMTKVSSVCACRYGELGALKCIIGECAIAVEPCSFSGAPGTNLTGLRIEQCHAEWFPPDHVDYVPESDVCRWISHNISAAVLVDATRPADDEALVKYKGPRIFGESLLVDEFLPALLEPCACDIL